MLVSHDNQDIKIFFQFIENNPDIYSEYNFYAIELEPSRMKSFVEKCFKHTTFNNYYREDRKTPMKIHFMPNQFNSENEFKKFVKTLLFPHLHEGQKIIFFEKEIKLL